MGSKVGHFARLGIVLAWSCWGPQFQLISAPPCQARVTVRVYDSARTDADILLRAQKAAGEVLKRAAIELHWVNCTFSPAHERSASSCEGDPNPTWTKITIIPKPLVNSELLSYAVVGLTLPTGVVVFSNRIRGFSRWYGFLESQVLAMVMAHELGHVLLGPGHGIGGLMGADVKPDDVRSFVSRTQQFTREDVELMQAHLSSPRNPTNELPQPLHLPEFGSRECGASAP
jgi:hypothetical protein